MGENQIYSTMVSQNNIDIIPFWFISESGFEDSSQINFTVESTNVSSVNYNISFANNKFVKNSEMPENENSRYKHDAFSVVDVIVNDYSGVKDLSVRTQREIYEYETPKEVYNTPKFSWNNTPFNETPSDSELDFNINILVGTDNKNLLLLNFSNTNSVNVISTINTTSEVHKILISNRYGEVYLSEYDILSKYTANQYSNSYSINKIIEVANQNLDLMSYSNSTIIASTESYSGKVLIRDISDFSIISEYTGYDAPFKAIRSIYHNCYFIAGTNKLWKLTDAGVKKTIYEVKDFKISDIDCSESGQICILLSGSSYDIIRVLDNNLYTFIINQQYNSEKLRFCKYCKKGLFYILGEINSGNNYEEINYIVDINNKTINDYFSNTDISTTTTTTTLPEPIRKFELFYPDGGEIIQKDSIQVIKWQSTGSISDEISLELYKGSRLFDTIAPSVKNIGNYSWQVSNAYQDGTDYKIKGTWLSASNSSSNYDISSNPFSILTDVTTTTTTESQTKIISKAIGIDYSEYNNTIVIVLDNGLVNIFDMGKLENIGIFDSNMFNANVSGKALSMAIHDSRVGVTGENAKARIFVGSAPYLNDKWDSGPIDTDLNFMYYGGGNNLVAGNTYYMNLLTYTEKYGWSEVQTKEFTMPI